MEAKAAHTNKRSISQAVGYIRTKTQLKPHIALILGSGLGDFADQVEQECVIRNAEIPGYPPSTVQGHAGKLVLGHLRRNSSLSKPLLVFQGRVHFYESGSLSPVYLPVQIAHGLGCKILIVTNAAGGINRSFQAGDLMLVRDIINMTNLHPGLSKSNRNPSRPTMYFDSKLQNIARSAAMESGIQLQEGVYCWLKGPSYETAAEIKMFSALGADAVGMSTVPEIVAAKELGMRVVALSLISNLATGISSQKLSHEEVTETANRIRQSFTDFMRNIVHRL